MKRSSSIIVVLTVAWMIRLAVPVSSAPITGTAKEKLTVYQGVATIAPGNPGDDVLELGTNGRELVSTGNIYVRPGSVASGARFFGLSGSAVQDLEFSGNVTAQNKICLGGVCNTNWPAGGAGYWQSDTGPWGSSIVLPVNLQHGVNVGPVTAGSGLETSWMTVVNRGRGTAVKLTGIVNDVDTLFVNDAVTVRGQPAWSGANDGKNSGLDADRIEGVQVFIRPGKFCGRLGSSEPVGAQGCICFSGFDANDGRGYAFSTMMVQNCIALLNEWP